MDSRMKSTPLFDSTSVVRSSRWSMAVVLLSMMMLVMMVIMSTSQFVVGDEIAPTCFGYTNSSGYECVHQLGSCVANNTCSFSPSTLIFGMGKNTFSQLGFPALNYTEYP